MDTKKFHDWLRTQGAQLLPTTNPYEVARFIAHGRTCIVYQDSRGYTSATGFAQECVDAFRDGQRLNMGFTQKPRSSMHKLKMVLLERDGPNCFFCGVLMLDGDITVEHLVGRGKGGPDHQDNLALAHDGCNQFADNLPLIEKIKMRERNIYGR